MDQSDMQIDNTPQTSAAARHDETTSYSDEAPPSSKKRDAVLACSSDDRHDASKKARVAPGKENLPATSTPRCKTTVAITPMTAPLKSQAAAKAADPKEDSEENIKPSSLTSLMSNALGLPPQVPNLFAPRQQHHTTFTPCQCLGRQCSLGCISAEYSNVYGWEHKTLLKEAEYRDGTSISSASQDNDPQRLLTISGIVPPPKNRTRQQTYWASPRSIDWDLDEYMDRQPDLAPKMRSILIDWLVELVDEYKLSPATFHLAVTLVDKSLACAKDEDDGSCFTIPRDMLQCLGCACTWIASKMEEVVAPSVDDFVYISDNIYRREQITDMEMNVCNALKFRLQHVTPVHYAHEFLLASEAEARSPNMPTGPAFHPVLRHMVYYLLDLSRLSYELVPVKPSLVAAAAVFLARATLGICEKDPSKAVDAHGFWTKTLRHYSGYSVEELKDTVQVLLTHHQDAEASNLKAIFNRYSKAKFMHVSTKTVLSHEHLDLDCFISQSS